MLKRTLIVVLVVIMAGSLLIGCQPEKEPISQAEAVAIVMEAMGVDNSDNPTIHVHQGVQSNKDVFNVYITVNNVSKTYVVAVNGGDILAIFDGAGHSH